MSQSRELIQETGNLLYSVSADSAHCGKLSNLTGAVGDRQLPVCCPNIAQWHRNSDVILHEVLSCRLFHEKVTSVTFTKALQNPYFLTVLTKNVP